MSTQSAGCRRWRRCCWAARSFASPTSAAGSPRRCWPAPAPPACCWRAEGWRNGRNALADLKPPAITPTDDVPGGRMVEVRAEHADARVGVALAEGPASLAGLLHVAVEVAAPAGLG